MRRFKVRLAIACMCAVATALFTGAALAGNGKDNAPGQVKQDGTAAQPAAQVEAQADVTVSVAPASDHVAPGQAKQDTTSSSSTQTSSTQASSNASSNGGLHSSSSTKASSTTTSNGQVQQSANANPAVAGMKPTNSTGHWTTCGPTTGSSSAATCTAGANATAQARIHSDSSKRYGNSQTAAEIAVSRGGTVMLKGPGNSQPHKTFDCTHKTNQSGGVDVHAIKQFTSAAACAPTQSQQVVTSSVCGSKSVTTITTTSQAALHGKGKHLGKGTAKHQVTSTSSSTVVTPTGEVCTTSSPRAQVQSSVSNVTPATVVTPATTAGSTAAPSNTGSVAGTQAALSTPKSQHAAKTAKAAKAQHGVLGTVAKVSGTTLPFTGFPLWMALVVALGLIGVGVGLRRRSGSTVRVR